MLRVRTSRAWHLFLLKGTTMEERRKADRLTEIRESIAHRIQRICGQMPREEYDALLDRMANIERKYELAENLLNLPDPKEVEEELRKRNG